jgi:hypothetical protein
MTDEELVKRLRANTSWGDDRFAEAADRILALTAERDRLREALRDGRRLWAIARDDRISLLIQLEQCEKRC